MADKDTDSTKLDEIKGYLDEFKAERKADREKLDAACAKMDAWEKEKSDKAKADAEEKEKEEKEKADKMKADAEAKEKDEKEKADKAKADAEKEEKEKADKAKADAARAVTDPALAARIAAIEAGMLGLPAHGSGADRAPYIDAQVKAERVYQAFGDSAGAPPALRGESVDGYQRRLLGRFKDHSPRWKAKDLAKLDASVLDIAEEQIYADAMSAALHPTDIPEGTMRRIEKKDNAGRTHASYVGDERAAWSQFTNGGMTGRFLIPAKH
jgi:chemotaxis protein histidine kinase CheA